MAGAAQSPSMKRVVAVEVSHGFSLRQWLTGDLSGGEGEPVGEAAGVVPAEGAVLEEPPALGAVADGAADVVDARRTSPGRRRPASVMS